MNFIQNKEQQKKDLRYSITDGVFWSIMYYLISLFLVPYIIYLGASSLEVGLIETLPIFISSFFSLLSFSILKRFNSKKSLCVIFSIFQGVVCILFGIIHYFSDNNYLVIWVIIFLFTLYNIFRSISYPVYTAWFADVFRLKSIGVYQAKKEFLMQLISIVPLFVGGLLLDFLNTSSFVLLGFMSIFLVSGIFRFISAYYLNKMSRSDDKEDILKEEQKYNKPIWSVFKEEVLNDHSFRYFLLVIIFVYFSIFISGPFNKYYFIKILEFNYLTYILLNIFWIIGMVLSLIYWGQICDKYGSKKILKSTLLFISFFPILMYVFSSHIYILYFLFFFDGMVFSGFTIAIKNYLFQNIKEDLLHHTAFFTIVQSLAMFAGTMLGSFINNVFLNILGSEDRSLGIVFIIGSSFRFLAYLFSKHIKDQRRRKINLYKSIVTYIPIRYGLSKLSHFAVNEERFILHKIIKINKKAKLNTKKEYKIIKEFLKKEEMGFSNFFKK